MVSPTARRLDEGNRLEPIASDSKELGLNNLVEQRCSLPCQPAQGYNRMVPTNIRDEFFSLTGCLAAIGKALMDHGGHAGAIIAGPHSEVFR